VNQLPGHIAFIMDGNGRWAREKGLARTEGHARGAEVAERVVRRCADLCLSHVTLFAFSTENWKRPTSEIHFLFETLVYYLQSRGPEMMERGVRIRFCGCLDSLPEKARLAAHQVEEDSKHCEQIQMILAINYGGRQELAHAALELAKQYHLSPELREQIEEHPETYLEKKLYLPDVPFPDLVVRTSGEQRISNFYLWQSAYSEWYFSPVYWPDFGEEELQRALHDFAQRKRRFGGLSDD